MEVNGEFQDAEESHTNSVPKQHLPYTCTKLSEEHIKYAEERLNETEETRNNSLLWIKKYLKDELKVFSEIDDIYLLNFLRSSMFDYKRTRDLLRKDVEFLEKYSRYINRIDTDLMSRIIEAEMMSFLPYRDEKGCAIFLVKAENWDPDYLATENVIFGGLIAVHRCLENQLNQVMGFVVIADFKNTSFKQILACRSWLLFFMQCLQNICPVTINEFHYIHVSKLIVWTWNLIKPFLNEEFKTKMEVNGDFQNAEESPTNSFPKYLPYTCSELSEEHIKYAKESLNETEEMRYNSLLKIKKFLKDELKVFSKIDDIYLLTFLRSSMFDYKETRDLLKKDIEFLEKYSRYINRIDTDLMSRIIAAEMISFLPYRDEKGSAIILVKAENWDPDYLATEDVIFGGLIAMHRCVENPLNQVMGFVVVADFKNTSFKQFLACRSWLLFFVQCLQNICPATINEIHCIHVSKIIIWAWNLITPFLKEESKEKVIFHDDSDWKKLHKRISPCILPEEYGGQLGPYSNEHWASDIPMIRKKFFELSHKLSANKILHEKD